MYVSYVPYLMTGTKAEDNAEGATKALESGNTKAGRCRLKPVETSVERAWFQRLKRTYDKLLISIFAFNLNVRLYNKAIAAAPVQDFKAADEERTGPLVDTLTIQAGGLSPLLRRSNRPTLNRPDLQPSPRVRMSIHHDSTGKSCSDLGSSACSQ